jgi:hypothetical protein
LPLLLYSSTLSPRPEPAPAPQLAAACPCFRASHAAKHSWTNPFRFEVMRPSSPGLPHVIVSVTRLFLRRHTGVPWSYIKRACGCRKWQDPPGPPGLTTSCLTFLLCSGLASSPWRCRPAGGRALAKFDQLPTRGPVSLRGTVAGKVQFGGRIRRNTSRFGPKTLISQSKTLPRFLPDFENGPTDPSMSLRALVCLSLLVLVT